MHIILIAIAGASGSGKTSIARAVHQHYDDEKCLTISSDNYYNDLRHLSQEERRHVNFDHPDSIDFELLAQHLQLLKQGESIDIPTYDFATHARQETTVRVSPKPIIIIEGILILHPEYLKALYDATLFVDTDADICLTRRLRRDINERGRDMESILTQYTTHVKPMFDTYVAPCKASADLVIHNTASTPTDINITPLIANIDNKIQTAQYLSLNMFALPDTTTPQAGIYQGDYTYWT